MVNRALPARCRFYFFSPFYRVKKSVNNRLNWQITSSKVFNEKMFLSEERPLIVYNIWMRIYYMFSSVKAAMAYANNVLPIVLLNHLVFFVFHWSQDKSCITSQTRNINTMSTKLALASSTSNGGLPASLQPGHKPALAYMIQNVQRCG